ncbi:MAG TPA: phosphotransferase family protein [Streptosporangiaceae bacterium]|nr:phosphotransferase family protein [Streptosporangiaceae bacterium]
MTAEVTVPGIEDVSRLARWLSANGVPAAATELPSIELIRGGRSNLTYRLTFTGPDGTSPVVLRRPPLGHVLPTAHDMGREFRVISALHNTSIPVARPIALCADPEVIGAPFYVMGHVDGLVLRTREQAAAITPPQARIISQRLAEMLAAIHGVDVAAVGLADFGRPEGYLRRQFTRWQRQWELSASREVPGYDELVSRLAAGMPQGGEGTLVHGDFRLDNVLVAVSEEPRIAAVVDWEMSTLGDPLADLGLTLIYWADPDDEEWLDLAVGATATSGPGFGSRAEFAASYAALTGRDLSSIGYYMAFGCFKLAVVLEGINARFLQHKTVGEGFEREGPAVPVLIRRAHRLLDSPAL